MEAAERSVSRVLVSADSLGESSVGCWLLLFYRSEGQEVNVIFYWHGHGKPKLNWRCDFTLQKYPSPSK